MDAEQDEIHTGFRNLKRDARQYVEKRIQLMIMTVGDKVATTVADTIQRLTGLAVLMAGFLFAWFALCFLLSDLVESLALGFLLGSLPLLLAGLVFMKRKPDAFARNIRAGIIREIMSTIDSMENGQESSKETTQKETAQKDG